MPEPTESLTGPPVTPPRAEVVRETHEDLNGIAKAVTDTAITHATQELDFMRNNPVGYQEQIGRASFQRILQAQSIIQSAVNLQYPGLTPDRIPEAQTREIVETLQAVLSLGTYEDKPSGKARRYVSIDEVKSTPPTRTFTMYRINAVAVNDDIQMLSGLRAQFPEATPQINTLIRALEVLRGADPTSQYQAATREVRRNAPANQMFSYVGKLGGVVLLGGAALLTGVSAIVRKEASIAPFLYGGALLYLINPQLLAGKSQREMQETGSLLGNPAFVTRMAPHYNMRGAQWEEIFRNLLRSESTRALKTYDESAKSLDDKKILARVLLPSFDAASSSAQGKLLDLIGNDMDFKSLRQWIAPISSPNARQLVTSYIREGSWSMAGRMGPPPAFLAQNTPETGGAAESPVA